MSPSSSIKVNVFPTPLVSISLVSKLYFPTKTAKSTDMIESAYSDTLKKTQSRQGTPFNPRTIKKVIAYLRAL